MTALSDAPDLYEVPADDEGKARFEILNDRMAAWAMRKARDIALRRRQVEDDAQAEIERVERWAVHQCAGMDRDARYFEGILTAYLMRVRSDPDDGRKSVVTPYGAVKSRVVPAKWVIDEATFLAWAKVYQPALIQTTERVSLAEAKKTLGVVGSEAVDPETGMLIPGVQVNPGGLSAVVSPDLGGHGAPMADSEAR